MAKMIEKDGKKFRMRRGKLVEIPPEWVGKTVGRGTYRKREEARLNKRLARKSARKAGRTTTGGDV